MFLEINKTPDISASVLWETLKSYIRGQIISYVSHEKKQKKDKLIELTNRIAQLDCLYAASPTPDVYRERLYLQSQFNMLTADHTAELIQKSRSNYYEQGDKAGRLLAHQLHQSNSSHRIVQILTSSDTTIDPERINNEFKNYYSLLYTSESSASTQDLTHLVLYPVIN